ncbi:MAG: polyphosphate kinase 1 [Flavobacteriales bacterium]|nr:polyphosphate kinase 1 [Flavobacteriia bacterium]NCP07045.1 polyphosphate kinase 1 [Flavobacteriales bacterium]PIV92712.1 MAG: polyphosphate kinase 1 [Flavobacteriaceae bacterium CG17_big_fil_post_rev_8_21_14_2_50_33_15]PIY10767.1 MAG: polyphosphate kinase 1 [Flavobacteriaceae bacterium CG_4_10_14_3_um_filter_33_47]PJB18360.1 MAG: polyphosphate kinase 1 [Flavobacteriaceae bacterium CG_4_9_14_3_um_filter_33_16]
MKKIEKHNNSYINREISWLQFNARVLQEAADDSVPLIERLRFLGIFSNNLDEFFKVRYATVKRIVQAGKGGKNELGGIKAAELLEIITKIVIKQQSDSLDILSDIELKLTQENIFRIDETQIEDYHHEFLKNYFIEKVSPALVTIILNDSIDLPNLNDSAAYLVVRMIMKDNQKQFALIEIPKIISRFIELPQRQGKNYIIMIDDLLRYFLNDIFNIFDYESISAHMIKITRDAELDFESDLSKSFIDKISDSVKHRQIGQPVRFVYDKNIHEETLKYLMSKMKIEASDSIIPGGRYHNRRDYMSFPSLGRADLLYKKISPLLVKGLSLEGSIFTEIAKKDFLMYAPYHTFSYVVKFLREAALDPKVKTIKITIYRLAEISHIASSLINAAINGKNVTVSIELQARFDEQANIDYAQQMEKEGIHLVFGVQGLKVHSKMCVIEREEGKKLKRYGFVSTGNFNESTAKIYTDYTLFTANQSILKDIYKVFAFFETNYQIFKYKHIITSPHYTERILFNLIDIEISNAKNGKPAYIKVKMNSVTSYKMVDKLYEASNAGVKIQMIVRGICCLIPGINGMSENIEVISIVDKFLEHSRLYVFGNKNMPKVYISSADWMTRNIENRVEVSCPIYDENIKKELLDTFEISWNDNVKSRRINESQNNEYRKDDKKATRSQIAIYDYYLKKLEN